MSVDGDGRGRKRKIGRGKAYRMAYELDMGIMYREIRSTIVHMFDLKQWSDPG